MLVTKSENYHYGSYVFCYRTVSDTGVGQDGG